MFYVMKLARSLVVLFVLAVVGTVAYAEAPPAKAEVSAADAEKFLAFMTKLHEAILSNATDCPKMATAINGVVDAHADVIKMARDAKAAGKKLPKEYEDKVKAKAEEMTHKGLGKCMSDPAVTAAFQRFSNKSASPPPAKK